MLTVVPPTHPFDGNAELLEGAFGLFDLGLKTAMGEEKGSGMIEEHLHETTLSASSSVGELYLAEMPKLFVEKAGTVYPFEMLPPRCNPLEQH